MAATDEVDDGEFDDMVSKLKSRQKKPKTAQGFGPPKAEVKQVVEEDEPEDFTDEVVFKECKPSPAELIIPVVATFFVIGIFPLAVGLVRQVWVRFKITSRRICITSGWGGNEYTEVSYKQIRAMKFVRRNLGADGDLVMELAGGNAVDMQGVPDFPEVYNYILERVSPEARDASPQPIKT